MSKLTLSSRIDLADQGWDKNPSLFVSLVLLFRQRKRARRG